VEPRRDLRARTPRGEAAGAGAIPRLVRPLRCQARERHHRLRPRFALSPRAAQPRRHRSPARTPQKTQLTLSRSISL